MKQTSKNDEALTRALILLAIGRDAVNNTNELDDFMRDWAIEVGEFLSELERSSTPCRVAWSQDYCSDTASVYEAEPMEEK